MKGMKRRRGKVLFGRERACKKERLHISAILGDGQYTHTHVGLIHTQMFDSFLLVARLLLMNACDMTHFYTWHDSMLCVT